MSGRNAGGEARKKLLEDAARLRELARSCEALADRASPSGSEQQELRKAAKSCREIAAEIEAAAEDES